MLVQIKKYIPQRIKRVLWLLKLRTIEQWQKKLLFLCMKKKHQIFLSKIKGKKRIRVIFLTLHKSVWKVDILFKKMQTDPFFEPIILVCPYTAQGEERMWSNMIECLDYFKKKQYRAYSSYNKEEKKWIKLSELEPDIVFFTNSNNLTLHEFYRNAFEGYLSCYVPYFSDIATDYDTQSAYNQLFHNLIWKNFIDSNFSKDRAASVLANKGSNLVVTGSPLLEELLLHKKINYNIWKLQDRPKKKIIYAPHQSIFEDDVINLSTFLEAGEFIKDLSAKYKDKVQWSFKPHPLLKSKLYKHPKWGKLRTDQYYYYWSNQIFSQLDEGDYIDLFKTSDSIIHDCGSFVLEYLLTKNPCAFLELNQKSQLSSINSFGLEALKCYERIHSLVDIEKFVVKIAESNAPLNSDYMNFIKKYIDKLSKHENPSDLILQNIKKELA
jgi:hypothetical protein